MQQPGMMMQPNPMMMQPGMMQQPGMMMQQPMMAQPGMMQPGMVMQPGMMPMQACVSSVLPCLHNECADLPACVRRCAADAAADGAAAVRGAGWLLQVKRCSHSSFCFVERSRPRLGDAAPCS